MPLDHICRLLHVSEHTVKAIEKSQAMPVAERKQRLLAKALRIADKAADQIENQIDTANISQATIAFGVSTEKALLLAGEPNKPRRRLLAPGEAGRRLGGSRRRRL